MNTIGGLIDSLCTVDLKMFNVQEKLYSIRNMTFEEFKEYYSNETNLLLLYNIFKKSFDLNNQRSQLIDEIDELMIRMIEAGADNQNMDKFIQRKHKTY